MITNWHVWNLGGAVAASGLPHDIEYDADASSAVATAVDMYCWAPDKVFTAADDIRRAKSLSRARPGSGHDCFLKGVLVSVDVTASVKWWVQEGRYHFIDIVSSMSTMHKLREMLKTGTIKFAEATSQQVIDSFMSLEHHLMTDEQLADSCPMGLLLTAQVVTNYLQLKSIYRQRHDHKLSEWRQFCKWIENLPMANDFILGYKGD